MGEVPPLQGEGAPSRGDCPVASEALFPVSCGGARPDEVDPLGVQRKLTPMDGSW